MFLCLTFSFWVNCFSWEFFFSIIKQGLLSVLAYLIWQCFLITLFLPALHPEANHQNKWGAHLKCSLPDATENICCSTPLLKYTKLKCYTLNLKWLFFFNHILFVQQHWNSYISTNNTLAWSFQCCDLIISGINRLSADLSYSLFSWHVMPVRDDTETEYGV